MAEILITLVKIIVCHLIGDYVLQSDFIAQTKGKSWYHLFVHCFLYCIPFAIVFGIDGRIITIFATHMIIDAGKARYNVIPYAVDQMVHYIVGLIYLMS